MLDEFLRGERLRRFKFRHGTWNFEVTVFRASDGEDPEIFVGRKPAGNPLAGYSEIDLDKLSIAVRSTIIKKLQGGI